MSSITDDATMPITDSAKEAPKKAKAIRKSTITTSEGISVPVPEMEAEKVFKKETAKKPTTYNAIESFLIEKGIFNVLKYNIENNVNTMLLGPTGVGKTEMITAIGKALNKEVTIFDMGTMTDPIMSLVGTHAIVVEDDKTKSKFMASRFSEVIQKPGIVVLDELSRAAAGSNNLLFPCLDFRRELPMEYSFDNYEPIKVHPDCVFIATANTGSAYTGTHKLDKALVDRFTILEIEPLNEDGCNYVIDQLYGSIITKEEREKIVKAYFNINKEHDEFKISFSLSMRHLKTVVKMVGNGFTIYDAFYAICKGLGGKEGLEAIKTLIS
jgi:nitric oxide reductase NorQ protein